MRAIGFLVVLLIGLARGPAAWAHASLSRAEPTEGAVLAQSPETLRLIFNEPITPLVMRLIAPSGEVITP